MNSKEEVFYKVIIDNAQEGDTAIPLEKIKAQGDVWDLPMKAMDEYAKEVALSFSQWMYNNNLFADASPSKLFDRFLSEKKQTIIKVLL
jgi:hypothetical protein